MRSWFFGTGAWTGVAGLAIAGPAPDSRDAVVGEPTIVELALNEEMKKPLVHGWRFGWRSGEQSQAHRGLDARASNPRARVKAKRVYHPRARRGPALVVPIDVPVRESLA
jgi:hypothetical protein